MLVTTKHVLVACALGTVGIGSASAQVSEWGGANPGSWIVGSNWTNGIVPAGPTAVAALPNGGTAQLLVGGGADLGALDISNPGSSVFIDAGTLMRLRGPASTNNGIIGLNRNNSSSNAILNLPDPTTFSGTGEIQMLTGGDNSQIIGSDGPQPGGILTNAGSHEIRGVGEIRLDYINMSRIAADVSVALSGNTLQMRLGDGINMGTLASTPGSVLQFGNVPVDQTGGGQIVAEGGQVQFLSVSSVTGGSLESSAGGFISTNVSSTVTMTDITNNADLRVDAGSTLNIAGSGILNDGIMILNNQNSSANAVVTFQESGALAGNGELRMLAGVGDSQLNSAVGATIDHAASHTIRGGGTINAATDNAGVIAADASVAFAGANVLELQTNDKANSGLLEARANSILQIDGITIDQAGGGEIAANGGTVSFFLANTEVLGGDVTSSGAGSVGIRGGSTTSLNDVDLNADLFVDASGTLNIDGSSLTNNGTIFVNNQNSSANGVITTDDAITIDGSGTFILRTAGNNSFITTTGGGSIVLGSGQLITGLGEINAELTNNGMIVADAAQAISSVGQIDLNDGPFINNSFMAAEVSSELRIENVLVTQAPAAVIEANEGLVTIAASSRIEGGTLTSLGDGAFRTRVGGDRELSGVTLNGLLQIEAGSTVSVDSVGLVNNGLIEINRNNSSADGNLDLSDATISGSGEIQLRTGSTNSFIRTDAGATGTIGSGQLVRGAGVISGALTNDGVIAADTSVSISNTEIQLTTNNKINNNQLRAEAGSLLSVVSIGVDQSAGGTMLADGGRIEFRNATLIGGTLGTVSGGAWATDTGINSFEGVEFSGNGAVDAGTTLNVIGDTLSTDAFITINLQNSSSDGTIQINEDTTFAGSGTMDFRTAGIGNSRVIAAAGLDPVPTLTNSAGHTLSGVGTLIVPTINEGTIVVGRPFGDFTVQQPLTLAASSNFNVAVGGNAQNGQLDPNGVDGSVALAGTLNVSVVDGEVLGNGRNHIIIDGPYMGTFDAENVAVEGQLITRVRYETDQVILRTRCLADTNLDGNVTPADFNSWIAAFNNGDTVTDQNLDGLISPADFNAWIINFNTPCP